MIFNWFSVIWRSDSNPMIVLTFELCTGGWRDMAFFFAHKSFKNVRRKYGKLLRLKAYMTAI